MKGTARQRFLRDEGGFTLTEVLVTMTIMIVTLGAMHSLFETGLQTFKFGNNKVEALENARIGLEKMERELRSAYPFDRVGGQTHLFWVYNSPATPQVPPTSPTAPATAPGPLTFGNNLNGNFAIEGDEATESISYYVENGALKRSVNGGAGREVAGSVPAGGFAVHSYSSATGTGCPKKDPAGTLLAEATAEDNIRVVCIRLAINVDGRSQTLMTDVALRNRGE